MSSLFLFLITSLLGFVATQTASPYSLEDIEVHFERFIQEHNRQYADENEKQTRFQIFKDNLVEAFRLNENSENAVYGITQFMDLTVEEFHKSYTGFKPGDTNEDCHIISEAEIHDVDTPESFDWRDHSAVTPVKNQLRCGSCYAFSVIGNIEGQYAIKYKQLMEFSEQQIIDCDNRNRGCSGGSMTAAFRSLIESGGSENGDDYPYKAYKSKCHFNASQVKVKLRDCFAYDLESQETVKQILYHTGPLVIGIRSSALMFYTRDGGIISDEECHKGHLNHAVLLVGYGTENGNPYWIVKNSWGEKWGERGYFRMHRGESADSCGMMNSAMSSSIIA